MSSYNSFCDPEDSCTCVHKYADGTSLEGSGTNADPYIHATPIYKCIKDSDGNQILPDANGCIVLPDYLTCILDQDGNALPINPSTGCFIVPSNVMSHLIIKDGYGNESAYYGGDTLSIYLDGQSGTINNIELPFLVGNTLYLPQLKVRESNELIPVSLPLTPIQIGSINLNRIKPTNFDVDIVISISQSSVATLPALGEAFNFKVYLINPVNPTTQIPIQNSLTWEPNSSSGQRQYVFNVPISRIGTSTNDVWQLWIEEISNSLLPTRTLEIDYVNIVTILV